MTRFPFRALTDGEALAEAARWALRHEEGELSSREADQYQRWLDADPAHAQAYEDANWALDATVRNAGAPELQALRIAAIAIPTSGHRGAWRAVSFGGAIAASLIGLWLLSPAPIDRTSRETVTVAERTADPLRAEYRTAIGERSAITLPDGSVAILDTDSHLKVAYNGAERGVRLVRGQAFFEVAKATLPFQVYAADQRITAVGTIFNVRVDGERVRVALVEGIVRVRSEREVDGPAAPMRELVMTAGDLLEVAPAAPLVVRSADVGRLASWTGGTLIFNDTPLADAIAEINRYTARPIAIADASVGGHRVTGVFKSNDPERFSAAMAEVFPIVVTHAPDGAPVLNEREP